MQGTSWKNKFLINPNAGNRKSCNKQRNLCASLLRKEKKTIFCEPQWNRITCNKTFWQTVEPFFFDKHRERVTLVEKDDLGSEKENGADSFNNFF